MLVRTLDASSISGYTRCMNGSAADLLKNLNEPQRQAVSHRDGPLLVLAGPGSGKTRVITRRAAHLVRTGVPTPNILAITFTNKAADEMRRRIDELGVARGMWVYTFHALGVRLLREFGSLARVRPGFTIYDVDDQIRLVKEAMDHAQVPEASLKAEQIQHRISRAKNQLQTPEAFARSANFSEGRMVAGVYAEYERRLERNNAVDFDDLLMRIAVMLRDYPDLAESLGRRFRYLLIDEYQDTNHAQYLIARYLSQHHRNICVTGDPDQSIYGWRGADLNNILEFERDYPDAKVVRLEENYRSTQRVLHVADTLISANARRKHKKLFTANAPGAPVRLWNFYEGRDEANRIAETISRLRAGGRGYGDFAIMYRVNALSRGLEEAMRNRGIPYRIARGVEFYNRKEIKDTLAYLHVLVNPDDDIALLRIINTPTRGIGKTTIDRLKLLAAEQRTTLMNVLANVSAFPEMRVSAPKILPFVALLGRMREALEKPVSECVSAVLSMSGLEDDLRKEHESGGEDRLANVQELVSAAGVYEAEALEPGIAEFLSRISLTSDQDAIDAGASSVLMLSLHAAKGLEFPIVFVVGIEQGLLPHDRALAGDGDIEEERRLLFVGVTRAQEELYLTHARQRLIRGALTPRSPSQFLKNLPHDGLEAQDFDDGPRASADYDEEHSQAPRRGWQPRSGFADPTHSKNMRLFAARRRRPGDEFGENELNIPAPQVQPPAASRFADWKIGTLVQHKEYGVGQVQWIQPSAEQTRAGIKFPRVGEKTFILEKAPIQLLKR
ncbi:MAG: UvrD-helicase domain-containing protein [Phycisphaerales bacterium]|nr:UvrD-helicase domain-containing protein [Phycisphaerales bacterium]